MTPSRPYLVRAIYDWIVDNGLTPHLVVDATAPGTVVPSQYIKDGQIVLNVAPSAVQHLELGNDVIRFSARFAGTPMKVHFEADAVLGIYARENGRGMLFPDKPESEEGTAEEEGPPGDGPEPTPPRPRLKVVK